MARTVVGILIGIGVLAAIGFATLDQMRVKCEVCMAYNGRQLCESAYAIERNHALAQAASLACAQLSSGVTDGIRCNNTPPASSHCAE